MMNMTMNTPPPTTIRAKTKTIQIFAINDSPVYDAQFAAATVPVVKWTDVCHIKPFIGIHYSQRRYVSRWRSVENKRPFQVRYHGMGDNWGWSATLAGAEKIARKLKKELS